MQRTGIFTVLFFFALFAAAAEDNIVTNSGFENGQAMWSTEAFINTPEAVRFIISEGAAFEGNFSMTIINLEPNDSKVVQWLKVKPDSYYKISCRIRAENTDIAKRGASITVLGIGYTSRDIHDTKGNWENVEVYGKTGPAQEALALALRLGFYGSVTIGTASFDAAGMVLVPEVPQGVTVINLFTDEQGKNPVEPLKKDSFNLVGLILIGLFILAAIAATAIMAGIIINRSRQRKLQQEEKPVLEKMVESTIVQTERRKAPRKKLNALVTIKKIAPDGGYKIINFKIRDISASGTFILSEDISIFNVGEEVMLSITDAELEHVLGNAVIVRSEKGFDKNGVLLESGYGIMFTSPEAASCVLLK